MDEFLNEILAIIRSDKSKEEKKELLENYHASDLADVIEKLDEEERNEIEERLDLIHSLKRKYENTIEEILEYKEEIKKEIEHIENLEEYTNTLKKQKQQRKKICQIVNY